jgi:hypothetical protein
MASEIQSLEARAVALARVLQTAADPPPAGFRHRK